VGKKALIVPDQRGGVGFSGRKKGFDRKGWSMDVLVG
jgi:hypothetical protein